MRKYIWVLALLTFASLIVAACAPPATEVPVEGEVQIGFPDLGGKTVTVAVENAYPPFNYIDEETGEAVGWDYDVVREICNRINCVPEFKESSWDGIFPAMEAGEYDWLADGVTVTAERDKIIDYSIPYVVIGQVLLVNEGETRSVEDMQADTSALIGTQIGTTNEIVAKENFAEEQVQLFEDFPAATLALMAGDVDGIVIDTVSAVGFMDANPGKMAIGGQITSDELLAFVFPPGSDLQHAVNYALVSMKEDGSLTEFNKKWKLED
jgi:polar amino acid transport system substrate-binding protein